MSADWKRAWADEARREPVFTNPRAPEPSSPPNSATNNHQPTGDIYRSGVHKSSSPRSQSMNNHSVMPSAMSENDGANSGRLAQYEDRQTRPAVPYKRPRLDTSSSEQTHPNLSSNALWRSNDLHADPTSTGGGVGQDYRGWGNSEKELGAGKEEINRYRNLAGEKIGSGTCSTCNRAGRVAPQIVSGLEQLHEELSLLWAGQSFRAREDAPIQERGEQHPPPPPQGLLDSLDWSLDKLNESVRIAKKMISSSSPHEQDRRTLDGAEQSVAGEKYRRWEADEAHPSRPSHRSPPVSEDGSRPQELPPLFSDDRKRPTSTRDGGPSLPSYSPNFSTGSNIMQPQSPMQGSGLPRNYPTLPSPSSLNFSTSSNVLPPMSPSLLASNAPRSPHTAHLQELQHQLSTKSLAHQILAGEHEKLLSAYSRLQTRCMALDKKSAVSDAEIANLVEDRLRLQAQMETAETQIAELQVDRAEASKQAAANGDQYLQIMNMSSQLQAKGAAEQKRWKTDCEAWLVEKEGFLKRIEELESKVGEADVGMDDEVAMLASSTFTAASGVSGGHASPPPPSGQQQQQAPSTTAESVQRLCAEVIRLRRRVRDTEARLASYGDEARTVDRILAELGGVGQRLKEVTVSES